MEVEPMNEDKQTICDHLCKALRATNYGKDIVILTYAALSETEERVIVTYKSGYSKEINVSWDSGYALIKDVLKNV